MVESRDFETMRNKERICLGDEVIFLFIYLWFL